jgi:TldD protein
MRRNGLGRREFLREVGAGAAVITLPLISGCATTKGKGGGDIAMKKLYHGPQEATVTAHTTYFDSFGVDQGVLQRTLERGLARGGDLSEVFLQHRVSQWVGMEDGAVNRAYTTVDLGAGIRVLKGDATGFAYCEDLTEQALARAAATAAAVADGKATVQPKPLAVQPVKSRYQVKVPWSEVGVDKQLPIIVRADKAARARDRRIIKVTVFLNTETSRVLVANSAGVLVEDDQPMAVLSLSCVGEHKGKTETAGRSLGGRDGLGFFSGEAIDRVATEATDHTVILFEAGPPPVGELPVVLAPGIPGILLHEAIGHGMEADFNRKGISIYSGRIGQRIAPPEVTIVDGGEGRMRGSLNVDDEGTDTEETVLVEKGILRSYMHDHISSRHFKTDETGSGRRESFRFPPVPRMRNTYMRSGSRSQEEIIASVDRGLFAEVFYNGQVFIGAGDFTFYLKHGRLIEKGKLTRYVKDANLIGNGPKVLEKVAMVGNDLEMYSGAGYCGKDGQRVPVGFGLPTLKVGGVSIGGRKA